MPAVLPKFSLLRSFSKAVCNQEPLGRLPYAGNITLQVDSGYAVLALSFDSGDSVTLEVAPDGITMRRQGPAADAVGGGGFSGEWCIPVTKPGNFADLLVIFDGCVLEIFARAGGHSMSALMIRGGGGEIKLDSAAESCVCTICEFDQLT